MSSIPALGLLAFAAVLNAGLLGGVLLWRGRGTPARWLGWILVGAGYLLTVDTLEHYDRVVIERWLRVSYDLVSLLMGCLLVEYVHESLRDRRPDRLIYAPVFLYLASSAILRGRLLDWFSIDRLVLVVGIYTATAVALLVRSVRRSGRAFSQMPAWRRSAALSALFGAILLSHLARVLLRGTAEVDLAPVLAIVALIGVAGFALSHSKVLARTSSRPRLDTEEARDLVASVQAAMHEQRLFTDTALDLAGLADAANSTAKNVSEALNHELGRTFYEFVTAYRVEEAKRLLADPAHAHLSLEAVGTDSGFRSRSSFYAAFKDATGRTPGDFRRSPEA